MTLNKDAIGWRQPIGCFKLQVSFNKRATIYWALLRAMMYKDKVCYGSSARCRQALRCSVLQCVAVCCSVLQALRCTSNQSSEPCEMAQYSHPQHTATHCNPLQHTAVHCNTLQYTATHCSTLQHTATHCNTLQHTATHCNTLH